MVSSGMDAGTRRVTLVDVARSAGVSIATVSYVVNGRGGVGEQTRRRVLRAAEELDFRPNRLATGLRRGRSKVLGLLLADIANPFYPEIASGVIDAATRFGYEVFLGHTGDRPEVQKREVRALLDHRCDGLIFTTLAIQDRPLLDELLAARVPFAQAVRRVPGVAADFVGIDDESGGYQAAAHLLSLGYRDVALIVGPQFSSSSHNRASGFHRALREAGVRPAEHRYLECALSREEGYRSCQRLLASGGPPEAIVCGDDVIALGAIDALMDAGLRVPGDVAVIGFDDIPFAASRMIELSTVRQPRAQIGAEAVRLLSRRIEHPAEPPTELILKHELVVRRTCGARLSRRRRARASARTASPAPT
jgi:LacI family transcriptional regulator, galactose operon repressor